ncbi:MAG: PIG-L family deacetylase [Saprospirales bacterium]|nr:PIG-L family deacetylase [Saprospirales bacterium]
MFNKFTRCLLALCLLPLVAATQRPARPSASDLHQAIKKLNVLGSVLYVAAHPDDENQRLISYCANEKLFNVTYLSLTRGDGGQNLIGPEIGELLGVLRTEELLMARSIDGGRQRFSRANDFGYSKTPDETLDIWNKDEVLSDVVWAIRQTQPDVIFNRFTHDKAIATTAIIRLRLCWRWRRLGWPAAPMPIPSNWHSRRPGNPNAIFSIPPGGFLADKQRLKKWTKATYSPSTWAFTCR